MQNVTIKFMSNKKTYWKGVAQLENKEFANEIASNEFSEHLPVNDFLKEKKTLEESSTSRRDFLKFMGFTTAAATLAACETPVVKSVPYLIKPDEIIPGVPNFYATTIYDGRDYASVLVKTREGRPIKIEANQSSTSARSQATILSFYDSNRAKEPMFGGKSISWSKLDKQIKQKLSEVKDKKIVLLTTSVISETTLDLIKKLSSKYSNFEHIMYDSVAYDALLDANLESFGLRVAPKYHFDKSDVIVSFGADFLGNWLSQDYSKDYVNGRNPKNGKMSRHFQIETNMSLSGANADNRIQIKPSEQAYLISNLYRALIGTDQIDERLKDVYQNLKKSKSSIVVTDSSNKDVQLIVNAINHRLGNYKKTINIDNPCFLKKGKTDDLKLLVNEMNSGNVQVLITNGVNPVYNYENSKKFVSGLNQVETFISCSLYNDETSSLADYLCPLHHNLESWGDANPSLNTYTLMQPTIAPLFDTRQFETNLLSWSGENNDFHKYLKNYWINKGIDWNKALHDGYFKFNQSIRTANYRKSNLRNFEKVEVNRLELCLYEKIGLGDGSLANNPWLHELPDPITRTTWDNYVAISASTAREYGLMNKTVANGALNGSLVNLKADDVELKNLPVIIQPGQAKGTIGIALGYGRKKSGKVGDNVGFNAFPLISKKYVDIELAEGEHEFACIQLHHTMMGRDMVKETNLDKYIKNPSSGNYREKYYTYKGKLPSDQVSLYEEHDLETGHFWNLSIDLTSCTGCAECVIACQAENNIPVVGKEEMRKSRDMHWMRIDRYYSSEMTKQSAKKQDISSIKMYAQMEEPSEDPEVVFQPVMCQHCNHAPCENVCPVAATTHSNEGLNQMTYNRCIGTRYCANNRPYKVRRFNWFLYSENDQFDYHMNDDLGKMVLNPDVVVRSRGVIEKCSMCIQKIQALKLEAKKKGETIKDEDAQTVCSSACSTNSIVFGDVTNKESEVYKLRNDDRAYDLLDHLNVRPSVFYQTKVRNKQNA